MEDATQAAEQNMGAATIIGAIAIAVVLFVSHFAGGYIAGRLARFSGAKQGLAVWLWAIVIAAGDVLHGAVRRVASAIVEGSIAIQLLHQYVTADKNRAAALSALLRPWLGHQLQITAAELCGPTALFLGKLDRLTGSYDESVEHLERAIVESAAMDAELKACEARVELADTLLRRDEPGDTGRAEQLMGGSSAFADEHGLTLFSRRLESLTT